MTGYSLTLPTLFPSRRKIAIRPGCLTISDCRFSVDSVTQDNFLAKIYRSGLPLPSSGFAYPTTGDIFAPVPVPSLVKGEGPAFVIYTTSDHLPLHLVLPFLTLATLYSLGLCVAPRPHSLL